MQHVNVRRFANMALLDGNWQVERVLWMRNIAGGRREVLVRWKGYDHHGDTWEPEEHVVPKAKITNFLAHASEEMPLRWYIMWRRSRCS